MRLQKGNQGLDVSEISSGDGNDNDTEKSARATAVQATTVNELCLFV